MEERARPGEGRAGSRKQHVDDRHGQEPAREAERAARLVDETGGDVEEAEARLDEGDTAVGQPVTADRSVLASLRRGV
jgi:hypothetical protein